MDVPAIMILRPAQNFVNAFMIRANHFISVYSNMKKHAGTSRCYKIQFTLN